MKAHFSFLYPLVATALLMPGVAGAQQGSSLLSDWHLGAVIDVAHSSRALALGGRDQGLQLGHSDLSASGPLGRHLRAQVVATFATHEGQLEKGFEEVWIETTSLPAGLQLRAGRFPAQIGYLNQQHPHADDFVERPLLYRAFYGGHWNDDGVRLNWTAPTPFYLMLGAEALRGKRLVDASARATGAFGVSTYSARFGDDIGRSHSWQAGLSYIHNRREAVVEDEHDHDHEEQGHEGHDHAHGAQFSGRKTWLLDATWKWAPGGDNRNQQVRVSAEAARITGLNRYAVPGDRQEANAIAAVWRFHPEWEVGARADWLRVRMPHGEHFHSGLLRERSVMLAWKPSHYQALRLQYTTQRDAVEFDGAVKRSVQLQYVMSFGAHGAHSF